MCSCDCRNRRFDRWAVRRGLRFEDDALEQEYLSRQLNNRVNRVVGAIVALAWAGLVLDDVVRTSR
jgi:hypothetical protein